MACTTLFWGKLCDSNKEFLADAILSVHQNLCANYLTVWISVLLVLITPQPLDKTPGPFLEVVASVQFSEAHALDLVLSQMNLVHLLLLLIKVFSI